MTGALHRWNAKSPDSKVRAFAVFFGRGLDAELRVGL